LLLVITQMNENQNHVHMTEGQQVVH